MSIMATTIATILRNAGIDVADLVAKSEAKAQEFISAVASIDNRLARIEAHLGIALEGKDDG